MAVINIEDLENIERIKYNCSKHGTIVIPIKNKYIVLPKEGEKIIPGIDIYCPVCISEYYATLEDNGTFGQITYEVEYKEGYEPKKEKRKTGEISD